MYLGMDLGTSGLRVILTDPAGVVIGSATADYPNPHPHPGWSEQDPGDWIQAAQTCANQLRAAHSAAWGAVRGIGLSGHMHGATLVDRAGDVLRPCILWNDTRASDQAARLDQADQMREITGNIVFPGFTAPKLMWLREHEPELFAKIHKVLLPKDYLRYWLTGDFVGDMSDSAGTAWLDTGARDWSEAALTHSGMRRDQMPDLVEGSAASGHLRAELCADWGLSDTVIVAGGGGDNAVAACGAGCFDEGQGFVSLGTSGVLLAAKNSYAPDPGTAVHTFCHAVPDKWYQMGVILAATDSLNWLARLVGHQAGDLAKGLDQAMAGQTTGPGQALFLPYLSGERTPHNDAALRGAFWGLDVAQGPQDLTRAVMEGVSFALRDCLEALRATGTELTQVLALGGGAQSEFWLQTVANTLNLPLQVPKDGEFGAAMGAARLAQVAASDADPASVMTSPDIARIIAPQPSLVPAYEDAYQGYCIAAQALRKHSARG
ncbi:MAG: xylulokinase [Paracoccaceae bacterium]